MTLSTRTLPSHIVFDEQGRPWVEGTGTKVVEIAIDHRTGMGAEQIHQAHDIPLAHTHAALAYYFDHQAELDAEIARIEAFVDDAKAKSPPTVTRENAGSPSESQGRAAVSLRYYMTKTSNVPLRLRYAKQVLMS